MRLSDIMGGLQLSSYPQIALVIFLVVFVLVMLRVLSRSRAHEFGRVARFPLEDDAGEFLPLVDEANILNGRRP